MPGSLGTPTAFLHLTGLCELGHNPAVKILFISTERGWHGGEEQLRLLITGAISGNHECLIAARESGEFFARAAGNGWRTLALPKSVRGVRAILRLRGKIKQVRPDVVYANDPHALTLLRWSSWGLRGVKRVAARRVLFPIRSPRKYNACDVVICVSQAIERVCRESGVLSDRLTVIHDGVDPARMESGDASRGRASLDLSPQTPLILCVAQLAEYKGHRYLLDAMPIVLKQHPFAVLALAGDGPLRETLVRQAQQLGIERSIRFLGYRQDVPDLVKACDLFVLASPEEGLGTAVLDAMFAGRPVVGVNAGGVPEMLTTAAGQRCGFLAEPRSGDSLAAQIIEAIGNSPQCDQFAQRARDWVRQEFTAETMIARTLEFFRALSGT
jgi:glycosyltransferase involved in cell wall biosynthesis